MHRRTFLKHLIAAPLVYLLPALPGMPAVAQQWLVDGWGIPMAIPWAIGANPPVYPAYVPIVRRGDGG